MPALKQGKGSRKHIFEVLAKHDSLTGPDIRKAVGMSPGSGQLGIVLRGEIAAKRVKATLHDVDGIDTHYYSLTARGRKHLEQGKVESYAKEKGLVAVGRGTKLL